MTSPLASPHEQALAAARKAVLETFGQPSPESDGLPETEVKAVAAAIMATAAIAAYLAALPAPDLADGLVVKPLEWHPSNTGMSGDTHTTPTLYTVRFVDDRDGWRWMGLGGHGYEVTAEDAKAAAQADYSRRILSAIDTSALSAKLAAAERERDATRGLLTDLADTFERFLGDLGHPQDSWQRDQIARARKETPDAQ